MAKKGFFQALFDSWSKPGVVWGYNAEELKALNPPKITLVKNVFIKVKDKKTGKIIELDKERYEIIKTKNVKNKFIKNK